MKLNEIKTAAGSSNIIFVALNSSLQYKIWHAAKDHELYCLSLVSCS